MPLVSVILTSYNQAQYLKDSIESILSQTFQDFELIIVDDHSTDGSWEIIQNYSNNTKVNAVRPEKNSGGIFCWEFMGWKNRGKYVAIHHSDDVWEPTKLEKQVALLESHPEYAACFTQVDFIDENSEHYDLPENHFFRNGFESENRSKEEWLNYFFYKGNALCHPSVLIRKDAYQKYGMLDTFGLRQAPDFLMWIKLCSNEEIYIYQEILTKFRLRRGKQENTSADRAEVHIRSNIEIFYLLHEFLKIPSSEIFLRIFPNSQKYFVNGKININFALAKLCLEVNRQPYNLFALNILFKLINNDKFKQELNSLYNYSYKEFIEDTGIYDIFGIKKLQRYIYPSLYVDYGDGFNEIDKYMQEVYIGQDNSFFVEYMINENKDIFNLRFDPSEGEFLKISIYEVKINNEIISLHALNGISKASGYDLFATTDPQYFIDYKGKTPVKICISGNVDLLQNANQEVASIFAKVIAQRDEVIAQRDEVIAQRDEVIAQRDRIINRWEYKLLNKVRKIRNNLFKNDL